MAKITEFENPINGKKGNVLNFWDLYGMILGVVVFIVAVAMGQNIANGIGRKVPAVDTKIDPLTGSTVVSTVQRRIY